MDAVSLTVERLVEKYTGQPLIGAGGYFPPCPVDSRIELRYDGVRAVSESIPAGKNSFGTHIPFEADAKRVSVVHVSGLKETVWFDSPLEEIGVRTVAVTPRPRGKLDRVLAMAGRAAKSVATGQMLSKHRWQARLDRWDEVLARLRSKLRTFSTKRRKIRLLLDRCLVATSAFCVRIAFTSNPMK